MNSFSIALNFTRRILREYYAIAILLIFPLLTGIISVNINNTNHVERIGISNKFNDSNPLIKQINGSGKFKINYFDQNELEDRLKHKEIDIGIIIPQNFDSMIQKKEKPSLKIICNMQNTNVIYLRVLLDAYVRDALDISLPSHFTAAKNYISAQKTSLGFFLLMILLFCGSCTELLLEDKKIKTYTRYFSAPIKEHELFLGIFITNLVLGLIQIVLFLTLSHYLFKFDWKIPVIQVFMILTTFLVTSIGISIGLTSFIKDNKVFSLVNTLLSVFSCFFGGAYFSSSLMGEKLDKIANIFPQKWAIQAYEKLVDGRSFQDVRLNLLILILFAAVFFSFGVNGVRYSEKEI